MTESVLKSCAGPSTLRTNAGCRSGSSATPTRPRDHTRRTAHSFLLHHLPASYACAAPSARETCCVQPCAGCPRPATLHFAVATRSWRRVCLRACACCVGACRCSLRSAQTQQTQKAHSPGDEKCAAQKIHRIPILWTHIFRQAYAQNPSANRSTYNSARHANAHLLRCQIPEHPPMIWH